MFLIHIFKESAPSQTGGCTYVSKLTYSENYYPINDFADSTNSIQTKRTDFCLIQESVLFKYNLNFVQKSLLSKVNNNST